MDNGMGKRCTMEISILEAILEGVCVMCVCVCERERERGRGKRERAFHTRFIIIMPQCYVVH